MLSSGTQVEALKEGGPLSFVNSTCPLKKVHSLPKENGPVVGMCVSGASTDSGLLATFNFSGIAKIYSLRDYSLVCSLHDGSEGEIEEHFIGTFLADDSLLAVGGKLKQRHRWSQDDDDNAILPCPIKIFDIVTGKVVARLEGHKEEVLSIRSVVHGGKNYLLSTSQDGYIIRWRMSDDWRSLYSTKSWTKFDDNQSGMVFKTAVLPVFYEETNKDNEPAQLLVVAACDEGIRMFDFDTGKLIEHFNEPVYSSYVDDICVIPASNDEVPNGLQPLKANEFYLLTRGVELMQSEEHPLPVHPNTVTLHKLYYLTDDDVDGEGKWHLATLFKYANPYYFANSWYVKFTTNGRYAFAPSTDGKVFVFALGSGQLCAVLSEHEPMEIRQVLAHPTQPLLFSCGDDGNTIVYGYTN